MRGKKEYSYEPFSVFYVKADKKHIGAALKPFLTNDAALCTDSGQALGAAVREIGARPPSNQSGCRFRVVGKIYHVQNVNAYDSRLIEWMRRFHGIAHITLPIISVGED